MHGSLLLAPCSLPQVARCQLCENALATARRLRPCGHVVCEACIDEKRVLYFERCPVCDEDTKGAGVEDTEWGEIISYRMAKLQKVPMSMASEQVECSAQRMVSL